PESKKPMNDRKLTPATNGPCFEKMPIRLEPIRPPTTISAITSRLNAMSTPCMNSSRPLCTKPTSISPSRISSSVSSISYRRADPGVFARLLARPRKDALGREALDQQVARIGLRDLEDVEIGVELDAHRAEGGDRLVEQHEPRGQAQVHAVDEIEGLADDLE